jgi:hypothetical protein
MTDGQGLEKIGEGFMHQKLDRWWPMVDDQVSEEFDHSFNYRREISDHQSSMIENQHL